MIIILNNESYDHLKSGYFYSLFIAYCDSKLQLELLTFEHRILRRIYILKYFIIILNEYDFYVSLTFSRFIS